MSEYLADWPTEKAKLRLRLRLRLRLWRDGFPPRGPTTPEEDSSLNLLHQHQHHPFGEHNVVVRLEEVTRRGRGFLRFGRFHIRFEAISDVARGHFLSLRSGLSFSCRSRFSYFLEFIQSVFLLASLFTFAKKVTGFFDERVTLRTDE